MLALPKRHTLFYGGARSGKTVLVVRAIMMRAVHACGTRHAMLRLRANAARASLWLDTLPKVQKLWFPEFTLRDHRMDGFVEIVESGSQIWITGIDDPYRVEKILGQEFSTIYFNECSQISYSSVLLVLTRLAEKHPDLVQKAFYDLNPVGTRHFTSMLFVRGLDPVTSIPVLDAEQRHYAYINPKDNAYHLTPEFLDALQAMPDRQRRRFYEGVFQNEIDGALWSFETLEHARCHVDDVPRDLARVVVAIDPSGTSGHEDKRSNNVGIVVAGKSIDGTAYVLADRTCSLAPEGWGRVAVNAYREFKADRIVAEANFGGDMVRAVLHTVDPNVPVHLVTASRGKAVRAEPVSALYGYERDGEWHKDQVRHAGEFRDLEDEMLNFSSAGYLGERSPDRADALVWALTDLLVTAMAGEGIYELYRQQAAAAAAQKAQLQQKPAPTPQPGSAEWFEMKKRQSPNTGA